MAIKKVKSSMVYAIDYDLTTRQLEVVFKRHGVFVFEDISPVLYEKLMSASSIGMFMRAHILGKYPRRPIDRH